MGGNGGLHWSENVATQLVNSGKGIEMKSLLQIQSSSHSAGISLSGARTTGGA